MDYISTAQAANKWGISERSVRNYCATNRIEGAFLSGKTWKIPESATKPNRINKKIPARNLLNVLKEEKSNKISGGIYHKLQIEFTYNSNHIEGSRLTKEQTQYIFDTNTIDTDYGKVLYVDDIIETANHFRCMDLIITNANAKLTEKFIKELHFILKNGTSDSRLDWFAIGEYKKFANEVNNRETTNPIDVPSEMKGMLNKYCNKKEKTFNDIIEFHVQFEAIHPFQDGNGRIGRLIMLKECLQNNIVPFIITESLKMFYYRGLSEWQKGGEKGYLLDTCLTAQDQFKKYLDYFKIKYEDYTNK